MLSILAQLLKLVLWIFGVGRKPSEAARHEEQAARAAKEAAENQHLKEALGALDKARETESRMGQAQADPPPPRRKARSGGKVFFLPILAVLLLSGLNCAHHPSHGESYFPPLTAGACPRIPLTPEPRLPDLSIPEPEGGKYCFTQEEMDDILAGIDALKEDNKVLRNTIDIYNEAETASRKEN